MPLDRSGTKESVSRNISTEVHAGKPQRQAVAIAIDVARRVKRQKRAAGGKVMMPAETSTPHVGPIRGDTGGRADQRPMVVPPNSYILPADLVSSLGEGNTEAGMAILDEMFGDAGGSAPARRARGGAAPSHQQPVPIYAADGEYSIPPERVEAIGGGDMQRGHAILDAWVKKSRKDHIRTLRKLPGPAQK